MTIEETIDYINQRLLIDTQVNDDLDKKSGANNSPDNCHLQ